MSDVLTQGQGFFEGLSPVRQGILPLQTTPSAPVPASLDTATGLLSPDRATSTRLAHFPEDLYDLRPTSHLSRFMKAVLGDSGVGQLRKRLTLARVLTVLNSTHFYDLDGFYGALFAAPRRAEEQLPVNPMTSTALPDQWDDIATSDSRFRERIVALSKALPMAGTLPGLRQAAEALTGVECDVYETWREMDLNPVATLGHTWDQVQAEYSTWDQIEAAGQTWDSLNGAQQVGLNGLLVRSEIVVRPKTAYTPTDSTATASREALRRKAEDEYSLLRVLDVLKPAGTIISVDQRDLAVHTPTQIAAISADSNFWQVLSKVRPRPGLVTGNTDLYPVSPVTVSTGQVQGDALAPLPVPPFETAQGNEWSYNAAITSVNGYAMAQSGTEVGPDGVTVNSQDWDSVPEAGVVVQYTPSKGVTDQRALNAARAASDALLSAHPYSGPRVVVATHG